MDEIVITGIGAATPIGNDLQAVVKSLYEGKSGISKTKNSSHLSFPVHHAGYIDYNNLITDYSTHKDYRLLLLSSHASKQAFSTSGILTPPYASERMGCILGTEPPFLDLIDPIQRKEAPDISKLKACISYGLHPHLLLTELSLRYRLSGPSYLHLGTCSAAAQAIGEGSLMLKQNRADLMLCGGISSRVDPLSMLRLVRVGALAKTVGEAEEISRPFDKERVGFTMGEGAVYFILERKKDALKHGRKIYAVVAGYGAALDGSSITDPHPESKGMILSMEKAIADGNISKDQIDYINAHGTSTPKNDFHETFAIKQVFGKRAYDIPVSSTKSMHGHLMSAAGAIEALCCIAAIQESFIPPTINYHTPDPECDLNYTPNRAVHKSVRYALSNSFGLGGQNAALLLKGYPYDD